MTIFRNPVLHKKGGAFIPYPLACVDVDPKTGLRVGRACQALQEAHPKDQRKPFFRCPNRKKGVEGRCDSTAFMYPRRWSTKGKTPRFHTHQGVDIFAIPDTPIQSVTAGEVFASSGHELFLENYGGYGKVVVIRSEVEGKEMFFLYAHCDSVAVRKGDKVAERDIIATVGTTCGSKNDPFLRFGEGSAHLHFEVSTKPYPLGPDDERRAGEPVPARGRLDPRKVLEDLGPWGMTAVHFPNGEKAERAGANDRCRAVEQSREGGYFPLGANSHWHGGVHLPFARGTTLVAPFDATLVAARLDPDPATAIGEDGSTNFILLRHEIDETHFRLFQGDDPTQVDPSPPPKTEGTDRAVGRKKRCANDPDDVVAVKQQLHTQEHAGSPYYAPDDPTDLEDGSRPTKALKAAIVRFQEHEVEGIKPDGVVDIPGRTWSALFDRAPPNEPPKPEPVEPTEPDGPVTDPTRTIYSLLMHVDALKIDARLAERFPWLSRVKLSPDPEPTPKTPEATEEEARKAQEHAEDLLEANYTLVGAVGADNAKGEAALNDPEDVRWVHKRLIRFGYHPGPDSDASDDALIAAIVALQNEHHPSFKKKNNGDGRVDRKGGTVKLLRKTHTELTAGGGGSAKKKRTVDPKLVEAVTERHPDGTAKVLVGLDVKVRSGEALWASGQATGLGLEDDDPSLVGQVHWEMFSEHLVVSDWEQPLDDPTDDLTADVPQHFTDFIEEASPPSQQDGFLSAEEVQHFYTSGRGTFFRRTPCRFVSHWGLDVDKAVARIEAMGFDTEGVAERLRPLMWWEEAASVLPSSRFVWHYNPMELLGDYAAHLASLQPKHFDPATHPPLTVWVLYDDGSGIEGVVVELLVGLTVAEVATTRSNGAAVFPGVALGEYGIRLQEPTIAPRPIEVAPGDNELVVHTDVPAPPPPRGTIHVSVRRHTKTIAGSDLEVWLSHTQTGPVTNAYTDHGKVRFENIVQGDYEITTGDAEPVAVTLDKKKKNVTVVLPAPMGTIELAVVVDKTAAAHLEVQARREGERVATALTDAAGIATFELPEGHYKMLVGERTKAVKVHGATTTRYTLKMSGEEAPEAHEGTLAVWVLEEDEDTVAVGEVVFVSDDAGLVDAAPVGASGVVSFTLPPATYEVEVADEVRHVVVRAFEMTPLELEIDAS